MVGDLMKTCHTAGHEKHKTSNRLQIQRCPPVLQLYSHPLWSSWPGRPEWMRRLAPMMYKCRWRIEVFFKQSKGSHHIFARSCVAPCAFGGKNGSMNRIMQICGLSPASCFQWTYADLGGRSNRISNWAAPGAHLGATTLGESSLRKSVERLVLTPALSSKERENHSPSS